MTAQTTDRSAQQDRPADRNVTEQPDNPFVRKVDELVEHLRKTMDLALELRKLALQQGDERQIEQSEAMVSKVQGLGSEFDDKVAGRPHSQVDDDDVKQLQSKASAQEADIRQLIEQLKRKVDNGFAGFGEVIGLKVSDDGAVTLTGGGLVSKVTEHEQRIDRLEQALEIDDDGTSQRLVRQETVISNGGDTDTSGALVVFLVVGVIAFLIGWLIMGFVPGVAFGVFIGIAAAVVAVLAKNRQKKDKDQSTTRDNDTPRGSSREEEN